MNMIPRISEAQALADLEKAAEYFVKKARWSGLTLTRINELRRPLLQLKRARKAEKKTRPNKRPGQH